MVPDQPASSSRRLVRGDVHVACSSVDGQKFQRVCDSSALLSPTPRTWKLWMSANPLIFCLDVACHVIRIAWLLMEESR